MAMSACGVIIPLTDVFIQKKIKKNRDSDHSNSFATGHSAGILRLQELNVCDLAREMS